MRRATQKPNDAGSKAVPREPTARRLTTAEAEELLRAQVFGTASSAWGPQKKSFVDNVIAGLPHTISMQARQHVGEVTFWISQTPRVRRVTKSTRSDLLKRIAKSAQTLGDLHAELYRDHWSEADDIRALQVARRRLKGALIASEADDAERGLTRNGLSSVLAGVAAHMAAIAEVRPAQRKRPPLPHGRVLRTALFDAFIESGRPAPDREAFCVQLQRLLEVAGLEKTSVKDLVDEMAEFKTSAT